MLLQPNSLSGPTRVFRADTPHDVISATLVARQLPPGRDVLAITTEYGRGVQSEYLACMRSIAAAHHWALAVDITGLPFMKKMVLNPQRLPRLQRAEVLAESIRWLRHRFATALGTAEASLNGSVDEIFLNCLNHPDVQLFYRLFTSAMRGYYPHGFDCIHLHEIKAVEPHLGPQYGVKTPLRLALDFYGRLRHGLDGVPVRKVTVDVAYTFNLVPSWGCPVRSLSHELNRHAMANVFGSLPAEARAYYLRMADQIKAPATLLLLYSSETNARYPATKELEVTADLVERVVEREGTQTLLIKPHPRNGLDWVNKMVGRLEARLPSKRLLVIDRFHYYPVEVIVSPLDVSACVSICSTSLRTLARIYGVRAYFAPQLLTDLMSFDRQRLAAHLDWIEDTECDLIAL